MKRSKFTEEQIISILREQEAGAKTAELCRKHGMSEATFYAWNTSPVTRRWRISCACTRRAPAGTASCAIQRPT